MPSLSGGSGATLPIAESDVTNLTTDLAAKAPLASPTFTGTPALPTGTTGITQAAGTSSTTIATTAFVAAHSPRILGPVAATVSFDTTLSGEDSKTITVPGAAVGDLVCGVRLPTDADAKLCIWKVDVTGANTVTFNVEPFGVSTYTSGSTTIAVAVMKGP